MKHTSLALIWVFILALTPFGLTAAQEAGEDELSRGELALLEALPEGVTLDSATKEQINTALGLVASANAQNPQLVRDATIAAIASPKVTNNVTATAAAVTATAAVVSAVTVTATNPDEDTSSPIAEDTIGEVVAAIIATASLSDEETEQLIISVLDVAQETASTEDVAEVRAIVASSISDAVEENLGSTARLPFVDTVLSNSSSTLSASLF